MEKKMLKPTIRTFAIIETGGWYDDEEARDYLFDVEAGQEVFELEEVEFIEDTRRQVVVRNKETDELWAVDAAYNGNSWGDEAFIDVLDCDVYAVEQKTVTVLQYVPKQ